MLGLAYRTYRVYGEGMEEIGLEQARTKLGELVDRARLAERPTRITRQGHPAAVVLSDRAFEAICAHIEYIADDGDPRSGIAFLKALLAEWQRYDAMDAARAEREPADRTGEEQR
jgi:prevent-host-death family protein